MHQKEKRLKFDWVEIMAWALCIMATAAMIARCFFGTALTDEPFVIADVLTAMHGNYPYAYNTGILAGQVFIPMLFYKIYEWFVPDLEGIFLFSRLSYAVFKLFLLWIIYRLLEKQFSRKHRLLMIGTLIPYFAGNYQNFSYNTLGTFFVLLVGIMLHTVQQDSTRLGTIKYVVSGFLTALAVFAHPARSLAVFIFIALIWINSEKKDRIKNVVLYCMGGIVCILAVMIPIGVMAGFEKLLFGLETFLFYGQKTVAANTISLQDRLTSFLRGGLKNWVGIAAGTIGGSFFLDKYIQKKGVSAQKKNIWLFLVGVILLLEYLHASYFAMPGYILIGALIVCIPILRWKNAMDWYIVLPAIVHTLFLLLFTNTSVSDRIFYVVPTILAVLGIMFESDSKSILAVATALAVVFTVKTTLWLDDYIFGDEPISELHYRVPEGSYKGIYTTQSRAKDLPELQRYLDENISIEESVSFRDNAPYAYLGRSKNICDIRTFDEMFWHYECNDPRSMYRYYKNREMVPDVIAYVGHDTGASLSVEASSDVFQFNDFVNQYYELDSDEQINETFRVLIYRRNELPDPDFDQLIASVK